MYDDPIIDEVRAIRKHLSEKHNFDAVAIFAAIRERQALLGSRLVRPKTKQRAEQSASPDRGSAALHPGR